MGNNRVYLFFVVVGLRYRKKRDTLERLTEMVNSQRTEHEKLEDMAEEMDKIIREKQNEIRGMDTKIRDNESRFRDNMKDLEANQQREVDKILREKRNEIERMESKIRDNESRFRNNMRDLEANHERKKTECLEHESDLEHTSNNFERICSARNWRIIVPPGGTKICLFSRGGEGGEEGAIILPFSIFFNFA